MKKGIIFILTITILFSAIICGISTKTTKITSKDKVKVVATLFPQYDFVRQIGGDKVDVTLLLTPGTETHTYEPTPQDIIGINNSNLFVYTGKYMEPWADKIASSIDPNTKILDASKNINLINEEYFEEEHKTSNVTNNVEENRSNTSEANYSEEDHDHTNSHEHEYDPHIWLNPQNAIIMVYNIKDELCNIDPKNKEYYEHNAQNYIKELQNLDLQIEETIKSSPKNKLAFGGTFAYSYFIQRYNLEYISAYDSCGENSEPSAAKVKQVIDYIKQNNISVIFYQELSSGKIADTISTETGSQKLVFHTIHNASQQEIDAGQTYITLMNQNLQNIKIALNT